MCKMVLTSPLTAAEAVAVSARMGTEGKVSLSVARER